MITELLIPKMFADNFWFNIVVLQVYVGITISVFYFGKELLIDVVFRLVDLVVSLVTDFNWALIQVARKFAMAPVNLFDQLVMQYFPIKKIRVSMIERIAAETGDVQLFNLINDTLKEEKKLMNIKKLEKTIVEYTDRRNYILSHYDKK